MSTYAIGDIQGCLKPLLALLEKIQFDKTKDRLWLTGDLINRGPDSAGVLRLLYEMRDAVTVVLGNHDLHFLALAYGCRKNGKNDTLQDLLHQKELSDWIEWLRNCPLFYQDADLGYCMSHAGIPPQWSLSDAENYSREVESALQSDDIISFLANMYGNEPSLWRNELKGTERLRVITNYFTRMRFCTSEGELELETKASAVEAPAGFLPWFAHSDRKASDQKIIFGHWAALEGNANTANIYALDTACVWGGSLTALRLEDEKYFRCECS